MDVPVPQLSTFNFEPSTLVFDEQASDEFEGETLDRRIMQSWGHLPFLMHRAKAKVTLMAGPHDFEVWALRSDGVRLRKLSSRQTENGHLSFTLDTASNPGTATWLYEIVSKDKPNFNS